MTLLNSGTIDATNGSVHIQVFTSFVNVGTMEGTTAGGALYIVSGGTNRGMMKALNGGYLTFDGAETIVNSSVIEALSGGTLQLFEGTISNTAAGVISVGSGADAVLGFGTVDGGTLKGVSGTEFQVQGDIILNGVSAASATVLDVLASGAVLTVSGGKLSAGATVETTASGGTAIVSGTVTNGGTFYANGSGSLIEIASGAMINGGSVKVGNGIVDIVASGSESISFVSGGSGGLEISDHAGATSAYSGKISGFGGLSHTNRRNISTSSTSPPAEASASATRPARATPAERSRCRAAARWWRRSIWSAPTHRGTSTSSPAPATPSRSPIRRSPMAARSTAPTSRCSAATSRASRVAATAAS